MGCLSLSSISWGVVQTLSSTSTCGEVTALHRPLLNQIRSRTRQLGAQSVSTFSVSSSAWTGHEAPIIHLFGGCCGVWFCHFGSGPFVVSKVRIPIFTVLKVRFQQSQQQATGSVDKKRQFSAQGPVWTPVHVFCNRVPVGSGAVLHWQGV